MALFKKNPNETAYQGGKKHFLDVLKNTSPANTLVYRLPEEDFNTGSVLDVMPGEEAVFIRNGEVVNVYPSGRHVLSTENYPFLSRLVNALSGGISTFNCVVVFVRTTSSKQIEWGDRISLRDPVWNIQTDAGIGGSYRIKMDDASLVLTSLFGAGMSALSDGDMEDYVSSQIKAKIKSCIIQAISAAKVEILGVEANLDAFSDYLHQYLAQVFEEFGISLLSFAIDRIQIFDSQVRTKLEENLGKNKTMDYMGENWARDQFAQALQLLAGNSNSGGIANTAAGLGMGIAAMPMFNSLIGQLQGSGQGLMDAIKGGNQPQGHGPEIIPNAPNGFNYRQTDATAVKEKPKGVLCADCGADNPNGSKFCRSCGHKLQTFKTCISCGERIESDSRFCNHCGKEQ